MKPKNILFDIGHPAHVHLFKNFIRYLKENRHHLVVVSREKDVTNRLLQHYGIDYLSLSQAGANLLQLSGELFKRDVRIFRLHREHRFDMAFGTSVSIAHLSALTNVKSFVFNEDDDDVDVLFSLLTYPFSTGIFIPSGIRFRWWRKKRIIHDSYHELAYLHPAHFTPDKDILTKYKLEPWSYIIIRHSALKAYHDVKIKGLVGKAWERVDDLLKGYPVIRSSEGPGEKKIDPWDMHHLLSYAKMLVTDSQTMTMEACALGVPSIRYNSFVGRISVLEELEHTYGLTAGFRPGNIERMSRKLEEFLANKKLAEEWQERRRSMLSDKVDLLDRMIDFFESLE